MPGLTPLPSSAFLVTGKLDVREAAARLPEEAPLEDAAEETGLDEEEVETEASD